MNGKMQGFTLIELLIVIAIIGILAAVLIPSLLGAQKRAYDVTIKSFLQEVHRYEGMYYVDYGKYFSTNNGLPNPLPDYLVELYNSYQLGGKYDDIDQTVQVKGGGQSYCASAASSKGTSTRFKITSTSGVEPGACS